MLLIRELTITFERPVWGWGLVLVDFWTEYVGRISLNQGFCVLSADGSTVRAHGSRVLINFDQVAGRPTPWNDRARSGFATLGQMQTSACWHRRARRRRQQGSSRAPVDGNATVSPAKPTQVRGTARDQELGREHMP